MNIFNKKNGLLALLVLSACGSKVHSMDYGITLMEIDMEIDMAIKQKLEKLQKDLHTAISENKFEKIKILIKNGASLTKINTAGYTPLHWAVTYNSNEKIIEFLISNGANVRKLTSEGKSLLILFMENAARTEKIKIAEIILKCGVNINEKCTTITKYLFYKSKSCTPLTSALETYISICKAKPSPFLTNSTSYIEFCLKNGAKVHEKIDGESPWEIAIKSKDSDIIDLMERHPYIYITHKNKFNNFKFYDCDIKYDTEKNYIF